MNKIHVQLISKNYEENDYKHDMDLPILYCANCMFHIPQKVGYESSLHQNVKKSDNLCIQSHEVHQIWAWLHDLANQKN